MADANPECEPRAREWGVKIASLALLSILRLVLALFLLIFILVLIFALAIAATSGGLDHYAFAGVFLILTLADIYGLVLIRRKARSVVRDK